MNEDELLKGLGAIMNEEQQHAPDARWDKLARGELSIEEAQELRESAPNTDEERWVAAFSPFDDAAQDRFAERALNALGARDSIDKQTTDERDATEGAPVISIARARKRRRAWTAAGAMVAVAAATVLFFQPVLFQAAPQVSLPDYEMSINRGAQTFRSGDPTKNPSLRNGNVAQFRADDRIEIVARPEATARSMHAALFRIPQQGAKRWVPVPVRAEVSSAGSVRFMARAGDVLPRPGAWTLIVVVGPHPIKETPAADTQEHIVLRAAVELVSSER